MHKWFSNIDWLAVLNRAVQPPYVPRVKTPGDCSNFDIFDEAPLRISEADNFQKDFADF